MTPSKTIPAPIAIASWGWYQLFDTFDEAALRTFYKAHLDRAPETE